MYIYFASEKHCGRKFFNDLLEAESFEQGKNNSGYKTWRHYEP